MERGQNLEKTIADKTPLYKDSYQTQSLQPQSFERTFFSFEVFIQLLKVPLIAWDGSGSALLRKGMDE